MTLQEHCGRGEDERALEVPKRIRQEDGDDLRDNQLESKLVLFVNKLKLSF